MKLALSILFLSLFAISCSANDKYQDYLKAQKRYHNQLDATFINAKFAQSTIYSSGCDKDTAKKLKRIITKMKKLKNQLTDLNSRVSKLEDTIHYTPNKRIKHK